MAQFLPYKLIESNIEMLPIKEGQIIYSTDKRNVYLDIEAERIPLQQIFLTTKTNREKMISSGEGYVGFYYETDTNYIYYYNGDIWKDIKVISAKVDNKGQEITETYISLIQEDNKTISFFNGNRRKIFEFTIPTVIEYEVATKEKDGLMSAIDKNKLDNLEPIIVDSELSLSSKYPVQNKVITNKIINIENQLNGLDALIDSINGEVI